MISQKQTYNIVLSGSHGEFVADKSKCSAVRVRRRRVGGMGMSFKEESSSLDFGNCISASTAGVGYLVS